MEDAQSVVALKDSTTSKIQQLQQAFAELENHRAVTLNLKWKELEGHIHELERSLKRRFDELEDQEKEFENKALKAREILEKREAAVLAKEHASMEKLQQKRDAALIAVGDAFKKYKASPVKPFKEEVHQEDVFIMEKAPNEKPSVADSEDTKDPSKPGNMEVKPRPELIKLFEEMNSKGLHKFISDNRKYLSVIRKEIPFALIAAANPGRFVLDSLEDFYRMEMPGEDTKGYSSLLGLRRTCIMLMECLDQLLADPELDSDDIISGDIKVQAKAIADEWKPKLDELDIDASSGNSLEAHAFLQILATFDIASEFDKDEISKLIPTVSRRRQTADLCRSLGLSGKIPDVIEVLVNSGRQIDAVTLAYAFELTEQFPPVSLLKSYLKEAKKASSPAKSGNASPIAQDEVNERELIALKATIKCIEEHKLEEQYPVDPLQKRMFQLEKAKADKKRVAEAAKPQSKRPRANGGTYGPRVSNSNYSTGPARYHSSPYMYERPAYGGYPGLANAHTSPIMASATYNISPAHGSYFGNGYQYQAPYLH